MGDQGTNAIAALVLGSVVAVLLFIPVAAVQYRRDGRLGAGDLMVLVGAAVYGVSLWTYTLLPLPDVGDYACQQAQTQVMAFADDIRRAAERGGYAGLGTPSELLKNQAFLQVVLNVVLFLPFGVFVRLITHRGVVVATVLGFAVSLLIEVTQLTGVWGVYPCAYRLFDVDDLLTNTLGAFLGAVLSAPYAARRRRRLGTARRALPTTVSAGRRLAGTASDVLFVVLAGTAAAALLRGYLVFAQDERPATDSPAMIALRAGVPLLVQTAMVLLAGKTVGELVGGPADDPGVRPAPAGQARRRRRPARAARRRHRPGGAGRPARARGRRRRRRVPHAGAPWREQRRRRARPGDRRRLSDWKSAGRSMTVPGHAHPEDPRPRPGGRRARRDDRRRLRVLRPEPEARPRCRSSSRRPRRGSCSSRMPANASRSPSSAPTAPTSPLRCTTSPGGTRSNPDWSPDGRRIVFAMNDGRRDDLWVADADGTDARMLLDCRGRCRWLDDPDWSPDGRRIVYSRTIERADGWGIGTLETVDVATGRIRVVLGPWKRSFTAGARYSPDGEQVVFEKVHKTRRGLNADIDAVALVIARIDPRGVIVRVITDPRPVRCDGRLEPGR